MTNHLGPVGLLVAAVIAACNPGMGALGSDNGAASPGSAGPITAEVAEKAALQFGGPGATVTATRRSTFGAEAPMSEVADAGTEVWVVSLSGTFYPGSCGPAPVPPATARPCPSPQTTARVLIDAATGAFILGSVPDPSASARRSDPPIWLGPGGLSAPTANPFASSADIPCPAGVECPPGYTAPPSGATTK
jgi:hypothetical protein